ncbi:MAG: SDR family oxidoreductase [Myxococcota bacterium]|nr:SDR family oxidoreductase [Myxococcota bacterium]
MGQLDGKVAIVTGTSRGIGVTIARRLLEEGASVVGCSRRELDAIPESDAVPGAAKRSAQWVCDQRDPKQIDALVERVVDRFGRLDVLINNAGGTVPTPHVEDVPALVTKLQGAPRSDDSWERTALYHAFAIETNLIGPLWFALRAYRAMAQQEGVGSIVNISSGASHPAGSPTLVSYGAAKAGLNHMTRSLAEEWGPKVRVNCLALGATLTDNFRRLVLGRDDPEGAAYFEDVPLRRGGEPVEVANACVFLCSGAADYINGTTIEMDGGMLPGVLYEKGVRTIRELLATEGKGS